MSGGRINKLNHNKNTSDRFIVAFMNAFSYACREYYLNMQITT